MSKRRIVLSIITGLAVSTTAFALTLPNGEEVEELTGNARWGCEVLLCCQTNGPPWQSVVLHRQIEVPLQETSCKFRSARRPVGNEAKQLSDHYDPCFLR